MVTTVILAIIALAAIAAALYIYSSARKQVESDHRKFDEYESRLAESREQLVEARALAARLQERLDFEQRERTRMNEEAEMRFTLLANKILDDNSRKIKEQHEASLNNILTPLRDNLEAFKKTVNDTYSAESRERFSLQERIKELVELNNSIGREARQLSHALRGNNKMQGDWGEMILENILEKSGLQPGREFDTQVTTDTNGNQLKGANGERLRPDVVVYYPDGRCMVIDSKVSLSAYLDASNAETPEATAEAGRRHLRSIKSHIAELRNKNYQDFIGDRKYDFVMMFIPNEGAYISAMQLDSQLWQEAYDARVLIVSPTHLISVLKLIEQLWQQDRIHRNVEAIAKEGGKMYDKFVGFLTDMTKIGTSLKQATDSHANAIKKLSEGNGNLVRHAENMRKLGARVTKQIPTAYTQDDEDPSLMLDQ